MLGRSHAASGWCAGLAVAPSLGLTTTATFVFATAVAGFALLPDLDCGSATASRILGPVTGAISWALQGASRAVYAVTKGPRDEDWSGEHRHLSHTFVFAGVLGLLTWWGCNTGIGRWVTLGVLVFGVLLAQAALGDWIAIVGAAGGVMLGVHGFTAALDGTRPWLWIAVVLGCVVHVTGDGLTLAGVPALFPIPIAGETWAELGSPRILRFRTGGDVERLIVFPIFVVLSVVLCPGVTSIVTDLISHAFTGG